MVKDDANINVDFINEPFPIIAKVKARKASANGSTIALMFVIAFSFLPGMVVRELLLERRTSVYHQQLVSGANRLSYWTANYIMDVTRLYIVILLSLALFFAFGVEAPWAWIGMAIYPFPVMALSYVITTLPLSPAGGQTLSNLTHQLIGAFVSVAVYILRLFSSTKDVGIGVMWGLRWFPPYALANCFMNSSGFQALEGHKAENDSEYFEMGSVGGDLIFFPISTVLFILILWFYEVDIFGKMCSKNKGDHNNRQNGQFKNEFPEIDDDVEKERMRVGHSEANNAASLEEVNVETQDELQVKVQDL